MAHPKFGALMRNDSASDRNPHKYATFVKVVYRRHGLVNPGTWYQMTDGKGLFWLQNPESLVEITENDDAD